MNILAKTFKIEFITYPVRLSVIPPILISTMAVYLRPWPQDLWPWPCLWPRRWEGPGLGRLSPQPWP